MTAAEYRKVHNTEVRLLAHVWNASSEESILLPLQSFLESNTNGNQITRHVLHADEVYSRLFSPANHGKILVEICSYCCSHTRVHIGTVHLHICSMYSIHSSSVSFWRVSTSAMGMC